MSCSRAKFRPSNSNRSNRSNRCNSSSIAVAISLLLVLFQTFAFVECSDRFLQQQPKKAVPLRGAAAAAAVAEANRNVFHAANKEEDDGHYFRGFVDKPEPWDGALSSSLEEDTDCALFSPHVITLTESTTTTTTTTTVVSLNNSAAVFSSTCPLTACRNLFRPSESELYIFQFTGDGLCYRVEVLAAPFDSVLGIIQAHNPLDSEAVCNAEDDDSGADKLSAIAWVCFDEGQNYYIVVSAFAANPAQGQVQLALEPTITVIDDTPKDDNSTNTNTTTTPRTPNYCGNFTSHEIQRNQVTQAGGLDNPTFPANCALSACRLFFQPGLSEIVVFHLVGDGLAYDVETKVASYDTVLGIIQADGPNDAMATCQAENDDFPFESPLSVRMSRITNFVFLEGQHYYIVVSAYNSRSADGPIGLLVEQSNPSPPPPQCFPHDSTVQVQNQQPGPTTTTTTTIDQLRLGDMVLVETGKYEPVYAFGHKLAHVAVHDYLQITAVAATGLQQQLTLSRAHMVFVGTASSGTSRAVPASRLRVGDQVQFGNSATLLNITNIQIVSGQGLYAPLTPSGSLVVNGIRASVYASLQGTETIQVAGYSTGYTHQWLYQLLLLPMRYSYSYYYWTHHKTTTTTGLIRKKKQQQPEKSGHTTTTRNDDEQDDDEETYREGMSFWLYYAWKALEWWRGQGGFVKTLVGLVFVVYVVVMMILDTILEFPITAAVFLMMIAVAAPSFFFQRQSLVNKKSLQK